MSQAGPGVRAARLAPYFTIQYVWGDGTVDETTRMYVVPAAGVLRTGFVAEWRPLGQREGIFRWATRGLRPFPTPRFASAEVDGRPVRDPSSYGRLFAVSGPPARDPAGREPLSYWEREAWTRYYERVRRHWIPVNVWSARPSPWGDGDNYLWISRRGRLLKRDGEVLRISGGLADCIRAAASLRACG